MYRSRVVAEVVDSLVRELEITQARFKEAEAVIKQLSEGRQGDVEYIHPCDLMALVEKIDHGTLWTPLNLGVDPCPRYLEIARIKYIQTALMPRKRAEEDVSEYCSLITRLKDQGPPFH